MSQHTSLDVDRIMPLCVEMAIQNGEDPFVYVITDRPSGSRRHQLWEKYVKICLDKEREGGDD